MAGSRIHGSARRYAEAVFQIAERDGTLGQWLKDLQLAGSLLGEGEAARVLANPSVPPAMRIDVATKILDGRVSDKARNLVILLVHRARSDRLPDVVREFQRLYDMRAGIVNATVTSATPLDDDELGVLRARLGQRAGGQVRMTSAVDPSILGGVIVQLGDQLIDGSIRGRLERLRTKLTAGAL